jgi:hypothetical protein
MAVDGMVSNLLMTTPNMASRAWRLPVEVKLPNCSPIAAARNRRTRGEDLCVLNAVLLHFPAGGTREVEDERRSAKRAEMPMAQAFLRIAARRRSHEAQIP